MSYKKTIQILAKVENLENIKTMTPKPRLSIFSSIAKPDDVIQSTLFDDIKNLVNDPFFTEQGNQSIVTKTSSSKGTSPLKCVHCTLSSNIIKNIFIKVNIYNDIHINFIYN